MRLKCINIYREITVILVWFYLYKVNSEYAKVFSVARRIGLKNINILGEFAKNNTSIDIKLSLSRRIFYQDHKNYRS